VRFLAALPAPWPVRFWSSACPGMELRDRRFGSNPDATLTPGKPLMVAEHGRGAAAVVREVLKVEPQLTLSVWRARLRWLDETPWGNGYVDALRLAGLPE
jgi:hypothetical protein